MASDAAFDGRVPGRRAAEAGFQWVSSSPSPAEVATLENRFPDVVQVSVDKLEAKSEGWQQQAILVRSFHRWVPTEAFIREFQHGGIPGDIVPLSLAFRCHIFRFDDSEARDLVLARPWVVNGQPIAIEAWRSEFIPAVDAVPSALPWIHLPNLPIEFWREEILREIVAYAGHFQFADATTMAKNRGGFARVCAHVDLRSPLWPGTRVRGMLGPFWQQFAFEHLEGICPSCGSLHLFGVCSSSARSEAESSSGNHLFGSWMSVVHQRKVVKGPHVVSRRNPVSELVPGAPVPNDPSSLSSELSTGSMMEGWSAPSRVAHWWSSKVPKLVDQQEGAPGLKSVDKVKDGAVKEGVPGLSACADLKVSDAKGKLAVVGIQSHSLISKNPFASLEFDSGCDSRRLGVL